MERIEKRKRWGQEYRRKSSVSMLCELCRYMHSIYHCENARYMYSVAVFNATLTWFKETLIECSLRKFFLDYFMCGQRTYLPFICQDRDRNTHHVRFDRYLIQLFLVVHNVFKGQKVISCV